MAFWHFPLQLSPKKSVSEGRSCVAGSLWAIEQPTSKLLKAVCELLPQRQSWSGEIDFFGQEDSDEVAIVFTDGRLAVEEIEVRIDCRKEPSLQLIDALCNAVRADGTVELLDRCGVLVGSERASILSAIDRSPARKSRTDPEGALREAAASLEQPGILH